MKNKSLGCLFTIIILLIVFLITFLIFTYRPEVHIEVKIEIEEEGLIFRIYSSKEFIAQGIMIDEYDSDKDEFNIKASFTIIDDVSTDSKIYKLNEQDDQYILLGNYLTNTNYKFSINIFGGRIFGYFNIIDKDNPDEITEVDFSNHKRFEMILIESNSSFGM